MNGCGLQQVEIADGVDVEPELFVVNGGGRTGGGHRNVQQFLFQSHVETVLIFKREIRKNKDFRRHQYPEVNIGLFIIFFGKGKGIVVIGIRLEFVLEMVILKGYQQARHAVQMDMFKTAENNDAIGRRRVIDLRLVFLVNYFIRVQGIGDILQLGGIVESHGALYRNIVGEAEFEGAAASQGIADAHALFETKGN